MVMGTEQSIQTVRCNFGPRVEQGGNSSETIQSEADLRHGDFFLRKLLDECGITWGAASLCLPMLCL